MPGLMTCIGAEGLMLGVVFDDDAAFRAAMRASLHTSGSGGGKSGGKSYTSEEICRHERLIRVAANSHMIRMRDLLEKSAARRSDKSSDKYLFRPKDP